MGGILPNNRLMGMCRRMGSHFHDRIDYIGVVYVAGGIVGAQNKGLAAEPREIPKSSAPF